MTRVFFDTNTLIYSNDNRFPEKRARCSMWLKEMTAKRKAVVNLQILNEFTNILIKKKWHPNVEESFSMVDKFSRLGSSPITTSTVSTAENIHIATGYAWWDCLLLASARELECTYFLSEDMADNHDIDGLTIISPFLHLPSEID